MQPLPLGAVTPRGWLLNQLRLQADGLTGHLDEFWPSVKDSKWIGGQAEGWERGPYWLDGLVPLAFLMNDQRLQAKAKLWVDYILAHQHDDGWLGAKDDAHEGSGLHQLDPWPLFVLFKAFLQYRDATGDARILPALLKCARRVELLLKDEPLRSWARVRWADFVLSLHALYELSGEAWLLELAQTCHAQGFDWQEFFQEFRATEKSDMRAINAEAPGDDDHHLPLHVVNNAMGVKTGPVWFRQSNDEADQNNTRRALEVLDRHHGSVTGMFNGDEHLSGLNPSQGHETCSIVEQLFSLECAISITGDLKLCERLERIAYNALPGHLTPDLWQHQYHGGSNQVLCSHAPRPWTDSGPRANLYGQDTNFGCCQANLHQGWPKFAASLWMRDEHGLVATAYAPCQVATEIDGVPVRIEETTDYPFKGEVRFRIFAAVPTRFRISGFVPSWAEGATLISYDPEGEGISPLQAGEKWHLETRWRDGDVITLQLPMTLRSERRFHQSLSLHRGPLVLALRMGEEFRLTSFGYEKAEPRAHEYEVFPTTPWNFALDLSEADLSALTVREHAVSTIPFAHDAAPVVVSAPAKLLDSWTLQDNVAAPLPSSPVKCEAPTQTVELVPFGSTRLRVAEFPTCK